MASMWDGARNLIDLGGLPLRGGGATAPGRVWRSATPESITPAGWDSARRAGLTTVIDLRNAVEREGVRRPEGIEVVHAPTEDPDDQAFLEECGPWLDHTRAWAPTTARYPEKLARVFSAIATAPGGVLVHCAGGRDRTGMVASLLLALNGVEDEAVADHYERGFRGAGEYQGHGLGYDAATGQWAMVPNEQWRPDDLDRALADRRPVLVEFLRGVDVAGYLGDAGVADDDLERLRTILL